MPTLDADRARVQDDLRGLISGEVRCDDLFVQLYASDGSVYEVKPLGVVRPRSTADVVVCVQYAAERGLPVHARGAGTGAAGGCLGPGLVLDFSKYLRRVLREEEDAIRVQPGVVHERLNAHLAARGRVFGPDPPASAWTTIGGVIATDASGSRWLKYGSARRHLRELEIVLADGTALRVGKEPWRPGTGKGGRSRKEGLVAALGQLLADRASVIRSHPGDLPADRSGYRLDDVLGDGHLDVPRLLAGSEGRLALFTEAVVGTEPLPRHGGVVLLFFDNMEKAARAVPQVLGHRPTACDLMDRRHLSLAREAEVRLELLVPAVTEAALLVEQEGEGAVEVRGRLHRLVEDLRDRSQLAFASRHALDPGEIALFWSLVHKFRPGYFQAHRSGRPVPALEDMAVMPEQLPGFLVQLQNVLKRHEVIASLFCHAGEGRVQLRPFLDLARQEDISRMRRLTEDLYAQVEAFGGTWGGGPACGLARTPLLRRQPPALAEVCREIKRVFDPENLLNPDKVVGGDPDSATGPLRPLVAVPQQAPQPGGRRAKAPRMRDLVELQLNWDPVQVADAAARCNGCGECRSQARDLRMCPMFRVVPAEESSPRAKANLLRGVLTGRLELAHLTTDQFKEIADLCVQCYMCVGECPARVDIPRLMLEAKGAYVAANGLSPSDWVIARADFWSALGCLASPVANWAITRRPIRWLMEKTLGIAQGRKLPRFASRTFLRRAARRKLTRPSRRAGSKVAYFVDLYANYHDPQLAEAAVRVFEHNGISVFVPPEQRQAGTAAIALGALDLARKLAEPNVTALAEAVRMGYHVVATEPAAAVTLTREYPNLFQDDDSRTVAEHASEACSFLWNQHTQGKLQLDFQPLNLRLAYHTPCRLKALGVGAPGENLLRLIPGVVVERIEAGCSGMAGTFGLKRENYRASLRMGRRLIGRLRDPDLQAGATECSMCKVQMEQGTSLPTVHPLKLLALAYGLMPETQTLLNSPGKELTVT